MMGVPTYLPQDALTVTLAQDGRPYQTRLQEFVIKTCATARTAASGVPSCRALLAPGFVAEAPAFAMGILRDSVDAHELESFQHRNHGNHSFGDPSQVMAFSLAFVSHADIVRGCLFNLLFFQYLAPGSTLVCVQYGASGTAASASDAVAQHFAWAHETPVARVLRVDRQWQSQVKP